MANAAEIERTGTSFLDALRAYLDRRLKDRGASKSFDRHEELYGAFLKALGFEETGADFGALMKHMKEMKTAGGVRTERE